MKRKQWEQKLIIKGGRGRRDGEGEEGEERTNSATKPKREENADVSKND